MKKIIIAFLALILMFVIVGCSSEKPDIEPGLPSGTDASVTTGGEGENNLINNDTLSTTGGVLEPEYPMDTDVDTVYVMTFFYSVSDLHKYVTTGSENPDDYTASRKPRMLGSIPLSVIRNAGYRPIYDFFTFDENLFDVELYFGYTDSASSLLEYNYSFDDETFNVVVYITPSIETDLYKVYADETNSTVKELEQLPKYSADSKLPNNGTVTRKCGDNDIIHRVKEGKVVSATFFDKDMLVTISVNSGDYKEQGVGQWYEDFMTSEKAASFAAFLSEDEDVVKNAFSKIKYTEYVIINDNQTE